MGFSFRKRKALSPTAAVNVSPSGASASKRLGPVSVSSRGRVSVRLGRGIGWRWRV